MKEFFDLDKDVLLHILSYCDLKDVRNLSQLSKAAKELFDNNTFWRNQLIHDFHFTAESVDKLRDKMKASYKLVYSYCENDKLNKTQENALENSVLKGKGLTENHLRGRYWFIERQYEFTLEPLVARSDPKMKFDMAVAIAEIELLEEHQLLGISEGLSRVEVIGLSPCQVTALCKFKPYGLTSQYLRNFELFNNDDCTAALEFLLENNKLDFDEAIAVIDGLNQDQCFFICKGLSVDDVTEFSRIQMEALVELREDGLTAHQLRKQSWFCYSWHTVVWKKLIKDKGMTVVTAMAEMAKMAEFTEVQVYGILEGLSSKDVLGLSEFQIRAMLKLKPHGLMNSQLRGCSVFNSIRHIEVLASLFFDHGMDFNTAIAVLNDLDDGELYGIANELSRDEVFGLSYFQIHALILLKDRRISAEDLLGCGCINSEYHAEALFKLISECNMTIQEAMDEIDELTAGQAKEISQGLSRREVTKLSDCQRKALVKFKSEGLSGGDLYGAGWFDSIYHVNALDYLVIRKRRMNVSDAMDEIRKLTSDEAFGISKGFSRDEIKCLSPSQMEELVAFQNDALFDGNASRYNWALNGLIAKFRMAIKHILIMKKASHEENKNKKHSVLQKHFAPKECFYKPFGLSRKNVLSLLAENIHIRVIQNILQPAVCEAFFTLEFYNYLFANSYIGLCNPYERFVEKFEDDFFCNLNVLQGYLDYDIRDGKAAKGWTHPCVLQALAYLQGIDLRFWHLDKSDKLISYPIGSIIFRPESCFRQIDLLLANRPSTSFKLIDAPEDKSSNEFVRSSDYQNDNNFDITINPNKDANDNTLFSSNVLKKEDEKPINDEDYLTEEQEYAFKIFQSLGLTRKYLHKCSWFNSPFHTMALSSLITKNHMEIYDAMDKIRNLSGEEAYGISKGLSIDEVIGLSRSQINSCLKNKREQSTVNNPSGFFDKKASKEENSTARRKLNFR